MKRGAVIGRPAKALRWAAVFGGIGVLWLSLSSIALGFPFGAKEAPATPAHWRELTNKNFFVNRGNVPVLKDVEGLTLVVFWADWCEPCLRMREGELRNPEIGVIVGNYKFYFDDPLKEVFGVQTLPTAILYWNDGTPFYTWSAGIDFKWTRKDELQLLSELRDIVTAYEAGALE